MAGSNTLMIIAIMQRRYKSEIKSLYEIQININACIDSKQREFVHYKRNNLWTIVRRT